MREKYLSQTHRVSSSKKMTVNLEKKQNVSALCIGQTYETKQDVKNQRMGKLNLTNASRKG